MSNLKYLWSMIKDSWKNALTASATLFVIFAVTAYLFVPDQGASVIGRLSNIMPMITAVIWATVFAFTVIFLFLRWIEKRNPRKRWLWQLSITALLILAWFLIVFKPDTFLSSLISVEVIGEIIIALLLIVAIVIIITTKNQLEITKPKFEEKRKEGNKSGKWAYVGRFSLVGAFVLLVLMWVLDTTHILPFDFNKAALLVLIFVTLAYTFATEVMARTVVQQRHEAVAPVIELDADGITIVNVGFRNIGMGPALNFRCWIEDLQYPSLRNKQYCISHRAVGVDRTGIAYTGTI